MLEIKPASVILDVPFNYPSTFSFDAAFPLRRVKSAYAALERFDLRFFHQDHRLERIHVQVRDVQIHGAQRDSVRVSGEAGFHDGSTEHNFYRVRLDFLVFADVVGSLAPTRVPAMKPTTRVIPSENADFSRLKL